GSGDVIITNNVSSNGSLNITVGDAGNVTINGGVTAGAITVSTGSGDVTVTNNITSNGLLNISTGPGAGDSVSLTPNASAQSFSITLTTQALNNHVTIFATNGSLTVTSYVGQDLTIANGGLFKVVDPNVVVFSPSSGNITFNGNTTVSGGDSIVGSFFSTLNATIAAGATFTSQAQKVLF